MICNSFMKDARQHWTCAFQEALILSDIKSSIARFGFACRDWRFGVGIGHNFGRRECRQAQDYSLD
jgi:hypothetical protein